VILTGKALKDEVAEKIRRVGLSAALLDARANFERSKDEFEESVARLVVMLDGFDARLQDLLGKP
jgi:hypothetical protein